MPDLKLTTENCGPVTIVTARGVADVYTCTELREHFRALIDAGCCLIGADVTGCDFPDSTGFGVLVGALKKARQRGGALTLICTDERNLNALAVTGLDKVFGVCASRDEAVTALSELAAES